MSSIVSQVLLKFLVNYDSNFSAGKLTRLSLIAIQVVCNVYSTVLQPEISHGLLCVHELCYVMLLEESGVLKTCRHFNAQQYSSI